MTETQARQRDAGPLVYVGPDRDHFGPEHADDFLAAVERRRGRVLDGEWAPRYGARLHLGGGRVRRDRGRARPGAHASEREKAARMRPRNELGSRVWPLVRRLD